MDSTLRLLSQTECLRGGLHQGQTFSSYCVQLKCSQSRLSCPICLYELHKGHKQLALKLLFDDILSYSQNQQKSSRLIKLLFQLQLAVQNIDSVLGIGSEQFKSIITQYVSIASRHILRVCQLSSLIAKFNSLQGIQALERKLELFNSSIQIIDLISQKEHCISKKLELIKPLLIYQNHFSKVLLHNLFSFDKQKQKIRFSISQTLSHPKLTIEQDGSIFNPTSLYLPYCAMLSPSFNIFPNTTQGVSISIKVIGQLYLGICKRSQLIQCKFNIPRSSLNSDGYNIATGQHKFALMSNYGNYVNTIGSTNKENWNPTYLNLNKDSVLYMIWKDSTKQLTYIRSCDGVKKTFKVELGQPGEWHFTAILAGQFSEISISNQVPEEFLI